MINKIYTHFVIILIFPFPYFNSPIYKILLFLFLSYL
nr:MAG TPA: hypothetical protein [Herelleviridae sp.]